MATGLRLPAQKKSNKLLHGSILALVAVIGVSGWYGYLYYTKGLVPPIPIPVVTADPRVIETEVSDSERDNHVVAANEPRYVSVPRLNVDKARILGVGVTENNELATPRNIHDVGWYTKSSHPGEDNAAVLLDGHNGGPTKGGIFERLGDLRKGDTIVIERGDGRKVTYKVVQNDSITLDEMNRSGMEQMSESITNNSQGLNIISCTGTWIPQLNTYDQRQVVRAAEVVSNQ